MKYTPVIIESPYAGDIERNMRYLNRCKLWCLKNGLSPYASHQMLTDVFDDLNQEERAQGIAAGFAFAESGIVRYFFTDFGMSRGMELALEHSKEHSLPYREIKILTYLGELD